MAAFSYTCNRGGRRRRVHNRVPQWQGHGGSEEGGERSLFRKRRRPWSVERTETFEAATASDGGVYRGVYGAAKRPREATSNPFLRAMSKHTRPHSPQRGISTINGLVPSAEHESSSYSRDTPGTSGTNYSEALPAERPFSASTSETSSFSTSRRKRKRTEELRRVMFHKETPAVSSHRLAGPPSADISSSPLPSCSTATRTVSWLEEQVHVAPSSPESPRRKHKSTKPSTKSHPPPREQVVALDCEMVGCLPDDSGLEEHSGSTPVSFSERLHLLATKKLGKRKKGLKEVSVAGRCTIVDYNGDILYDSFIRPNRRILSLRTFVSGITQEDMAKATPIDDARQEILGILQGSLVVAHDIKHDLASLDISLPPESIWDTSHCKALRRLAGLLESQVPSLRKLAHGVLGVQIHAGGCHSSREDARVAMQLYRAVEE